MADSFTNRGLVLQITGSNVGTWGTDLNNNMITITDQILGSTLAYTVSGGTNNLTQTQSENLAFTLSGALASACIVTLPLNIATSATTAVGGLFLFTNSTTGGYSVTVKTVASGSTGVTVPNGLRALLYSNGTNVYYSNDGGKAMASSVLGYAGNPDGVVTCTPASAVAPADMLWDYTNEVLYVCTAAPNEWTQVIPTSVTSIPTPACGYLTLASSTTNPILANDAVAATSVYYTPYTGAVIGIPNGSTYSTYTFSQLTLALSATYQVANGIYDVFAFLNSGVAAIGLGPIWTTGGGSVTPGSCARGTGAGSTQLSRLLGTYANTVSMTVNNGATTYSVGALNATLLGSVAIDSTAGQTTCHTSWGQSRKWGVWNAYNRRQLYLKAGDSTASWDYNTNTIRPSNGSTANSLSIFSGLQEETCRADFNQILHCTVSDNAQIGIGYSSVVAMSGKRGWANAGVNAGDFISLNQEMCASYLGPPFLGLVTITSLETSPGSGGNTFNGTESDMLLSAQWQG